MTKRLEIEEAENGYVVKCWEGDDDSKDDYGYETPDQHVAKDIPEVTALVASLLKE